MTTSLHDTVKVIKDIVLVNVIGVLTIMLTIFAMRNVPVQSSVEHIVTEFNELDATFVCEINKCNKVRINEQWFRYDEDKVELVPTKDKKVGLLSYKYEYAYKGVSYAFYIDFTNNEKLIIAMLLVMLVITIVLDIILARKAINSIEGVNAVNLKVHESSLHNSNIVMVAQTANHEINTPLSGIDSGLMEMEYSLMDMYQEFCNSSDKVPEWGKFLFTGSNGTLNTEELKKYVDNPYGEHIPMTEFVQEIHKFRLLVGNIRNVMNKLGGFKRIRNSNGDQSIYDITTVAVDTLQFDYRVKLDYTVDAKLKCFASRKLSNHDLLHIMFNHIKNAIEADSTSLSVTYLDCDSKYVEVVITDNGNGVPESKLDTLYDFKVSSKKGSTNEGLGMYVSKELLVDAQGNDELLFTSSRGTAFKLRIPYKKAHCEACSNKNTCSIYTKQ